MLVRALSDQHGLLPEVEPCDLLLIAGDVCPITDHTPDYQAEWLEHEFGPWLEGLPAKEIVGIAGNHDFVFEQTKLVPKLPWTYLQDSAATIEGLTVYGTPWTPRLGPWAFEGDENPDLRTMFGAIPDDVDVLVTHAPPRGIGDLTVGFGTRHGENVGSPALREAVARVEPTLAVFGHIHEGRGQWSEGPTRLANVALLDHRYRPQGGPSSFEL